MGNWVLAVEFLVVFMVTACAIVLNDRRVIQDLREKNAKIAVENARLKQEILANGVSIGQETVEIGGHTYVYLVPSKESK